MKIKDVLKALGALVILAVLIIVAWALLTSMVKVFGDYTSTIEPTIVVAIISGLGAIIINAISKYGDRKSQQLTKQQEKMSLIYESFLDELQVAVKEQSTDSTDKVLSKYKPKFEVNASDDTYNEFCAIETVFKNTQQIQTDRLILSIRKELKVSNKKTTTNK